MSYDLTLGTLFIGVVVSAACWGVSCSQVVTYFRSFPDDTRWVKCFVAIVWAVDTFHQGLITHALYFYTVTHFGNNERLMHNVITLAIQTPVQEVTAFLVQGFFTYRIWKISEKNVILTLSVALLVATQLVLVIVNTIGNIQSQTFSELGELQRAVTPAASGVTAAVDIAIAGILCFMLHLGRTGIESDNVTARTNHVINRLMIFALSTGALTSLCAVAILVTYLAVPNTFLYIAFYFLIGRLYVNSLMVALNMRSSMRRMWKPDSSFSVRLGSDIPMSPQTLVSTKWPSKFGEGPSAV